MSASEVDARETSAAVANGNCSTKKPRLCFVDSEGNAMNISSAKELKAALASLEGSENKETDDADGGGPGCNVWNDEKTEGYNDVSTRTTNATQESFLGEVKRFELFRQVIQHEDDLLNQRVSWIILAQSFLMAAFITNTSDDGSGDALRYITATVGLLTVVVTMPAILAAGRNIELQQQVYFAKISSDERCLELHGHVRDRNVNADVRAEHRNRVEGGHIFPNMAFRGRGGVPILYTVVALAIVQVAGWCFLLVALGMGW